MIDVSGDGEFYYLSEVIGGENAFVLGADDYNDVARAIRIKFIKEINNAPMSGRRDRPPLYARGPSDRVTGDDPG